MELTYCLVFFLAFCISPHLEVESKSSGTHIRGIQVSVSSTSKPQKVNLKPVKYEVGFLKTAGIRVYFQRAAVVNASVPKFTILLLHGAAFTSQTWRKLGTLRFLARNGYDPIAIDLPGFGKSRGSFRGKTNEFMHKLIENLGIERPVLVSPSMSGRYSIPYVLQHFNKLRGYIPIAPSNSGGTKAKFSQVVLPALIIFGSRDGYGKRISQIIANIPGSMQKVIPNGRHPAYLDNPKLFHSYVKKFLDELYKDEAEPFASSNVTESSFVNTTAHAELNTTTTSSSVDSD